MQVFEFHFNPKAKKPPSSALLVKTGVPDLIFDSFCYEPENIYEKRLGSLYLVGELKNVLPNDLNFLEKISQMCIRDRARALLRAEETSFTASS